MARSKNNHHKILLGLTVGAASIIIIGGAASTIFQSDKTFTNLPAFPVRAFIDNSSLWDKSDYILRGRVENVLMRSQDDTRALISFQPEANDLLLPIVITLTDSKLLPQREQRLVMRVRLGPRGEILAEDFRTD